MEYIHITNSTKLRSYLKRFGEPGEHIIALDIEADSNCHAYGEKLCLIQIFDGVNRVIIDPVDIDTRTLKRLFEDPKVLKMMYDAGSDMALLQNSMGIYIKSILDLRPAVELLEYEKKNLHFVIAAELGVMLEDKKKFQQQNWITRPLAEDAIDYALNDVIHLFALKDIILAKLYVKKLFEPFFLRNLQVQNRDYTRDPEDRYKKINGFSRLNEKERANFRKVFDIREKYAEKYDVPAHYVIPKNDLIGIVLDPRTINKIRFSRRFAKEVTLKMLEELKKVFRRKK
jgi:ribonuclease D